MDSLLNQTINLYSKIQITLQPIHVTFEGKAKKNILQRTAKSEANLTSSLQPHMYTQKIATIFDHI